MVQRSRIASVSDMQALRRQRRGGLSRPAQAAAKHLAAVLLLAGTIYALPQIFGPRFYHNQLNSAMSLASSAGGWVRSGLAVAFQSIPVR
jgi:hypothetical protein